MTKNYVGPTRPKKNTETEAEAVETLKTESEVAAKEEDVVEAVTTESEKTTKTEETTEIAETADIPVTEEATAESADGTEVVTEKQPKADDPNEPIVFANRPLATGRSCLL